MNSRTTQIPEAWLMHSWAVKAAGAFQKPVRAERTGGERCAMEAQHWLPVRCAGQWAEWIQDY